MSGPQEVEGATTGPPQTLSEFVGQTKIRQNLGVFMAAARGRGEPLDHVLLSGPAGIGKTTLAKVIAREMGGQLFTPGILQRAGDLAGILARMQPRDCLLIEDVHRLNPVVQEVLLPAMEDYRLDITIGAGAFGAGSMARVIKHDLSPFTLIGETTRPGALSDEFRARFGIKIRLEPYDVESMTRILERVARSIDIRAAPEALREIALCSGGNPRTARGLLPRLRDFAEMAGKNVIDLDTARKALSRLVDERDRAIPSDRDRISEDVRLFVWRRDQGKCVRCGSQSRLEYDHVIPIVEGGSSSQRNVQLLCEACNRAKGRTI